MIEIVNATPAIIERFTGAPMKDTARAALAALDGDRIVGIAGISIKPQMYLLWSDMTSELREHPKLILRGFKRLLAVAAKRSMPVYAYADPLIKNSAKLLEHVGFKHHQKCIYIWRAHV